MEKRNSKTPTPSEAAMNAFLDRVLPGSSPRVIELRRQVIEFCASPTARTVLIEGPIGVGKSTLARAIAALKRVAPLKADKATETLADIRFAGPNLIDLNAIPWYVELPLTGLAAELAESQLFGSVVGAYTGAKDRAGVFELAMRGRRKHSDKIPEGALVTGGVVFLDEIGDLSLAHQAKLLPVLSGGAFYRLGQEGEADSEIVFEGVVAAATWKALGPNNFRPDLLSRLSAYRLKMPAIAERMEDFDAVLGSVEEGIRNRLSAAISKMLKADPYVDRDYWRTRSAALPRLTSEDRAFLRQVDWSLRGNLRGLTSVVELVMNRGISAEEAFVVAGEEWTVDAGAVDPVTAVIDAALQTPKSKNTVAGHFATVEQELRERVHDRLCTDKGLESRLAEHLGVLPEDVRKQRSELKRDRGTR